MVAHNWRYIFCNGKGECFFLRKLRLNFIIYLTSKKTFFLPGKKMSNHRRGDLHDDFVESGADYKNPYERHKALHWMDRYELFVGIISGLAAIALSLPFIIAIVGSTYIVSDSLVYVITYTSVMGLLLLLYFIPRLIAVIICGPCCSTSPYREPHMKCQCADKHWLIFRTLLALYYIVNLFYLWFWISDFQSISNDPETNSFNGSLQWKQISKVNAVLGTVITFSFISVVTRTFYSKESYDEGSEVFYVKYTNN